MRPYACARSRTAARLRLANLSLDLKLSAVYCTQYDPARDSGPRRTMASKVTRTFFEKVWSDHFITDLGDDTLLLQIDRLFLHELSGSVTLRELAQSGRAPDSPQQVFAVVDHVVSTRPGRGPDDGRNATASEMIRQTRRAVGELGIRFFDVGDPRQGIVHVVSPELAIALPAGTLEQVKPKTMRIRFDGALQPGVGAKDLVLSLIGRVGANGGIGFAVEFAGPVVQAMPIEQRLTLCNMAIEFSAKYGFVSPDDATYEYLAGREFAPKGEQWDRAVAYWRTLPSDADAEFDRELVIDAAAIEPQVTWGTSPQHVVGVGGTVPSPADFSDPGARTLVERALDYQQLKP